MIEQNQLLGRWTHSVEELRILRDKHGRRGEDWRKEFINGRGWTVLWDERLVSKVDEVFGVKNAPLPQAEPDGQGASTMPMGNADAPSETLSLAPGVLAADVQKMAPPPNRGILVELPWGYNPKTDRRSDRPPQVKGHLPGKKPANYLQLLFIYIKRPWRPLPPGSKILAKNLGNPQIYEQL